jgi:hypothetical protein
MLEDSEGYAHWQYCMTLVLEDSDLMGVIDRTYAKLSTMLDTAGYADWVHRDHQVVFKGPVHWTENLTVTGLDWTKKDWTESPVQSSL